MSARLAKALRLACNAFGELADAVDEETGSRSARSRAMWDTRNRALHSACAQLWMWLYGEPWPYQVKVRWAPRSGGALGWAHVGAAETGGELVVSYADLSAEKDPVVTLVHEFEHLRGHRHGRKMLQAVNSCLDRLNLPREKMKDHPKDPKAPNGALPKATRSSPSRSR